MLWKGFQVELGDVVFHGGEDHLYVGNNKFLPLRKLKMKEEMYYVWSGQYVGNAMVWWGKNRSGYTCDLDKAGKYTKEEAIEITNCRDSDSAFLCKRIDENAIRTVDAQHISIGSPDIKSEWEVKS